MEQQSNVGERIAHYRKMVGMSAQALADAAGLTRAIITNIESGRRSDPTVSQLIAIAATLGVSPADLVFDLRDPYAYVELAPDRVAAQWLARDWFGGARNLTEVTDAPTGGRGWLAGNENWLISYALKQRDSVAYALAAHEQFLEQFAKDPEAVGSNWKNTSPDEARRKVQQWRAELYELERQLRAYGVNIDRPIVHPGVPF